MPRKKLAVAALMQKIGGADKQAATAALADLVSMGAEAESAAPAMRAMLKDKVPQRALGARAVLAAIGEDTALHVDTLIERAAVGRSDETTVARMLLRELAPGAVAEGIVRAFQHVRAEVRTRAVALAGSTAAFREAISADDLIALLQDPDGKVREAALQALHQHLAPAPPAKPTAQLTPERRALITPMLTNSDRAVVAQAKRLWDKLGLKP
jgi:hypothetical protein